MGLKEKFSLVRIIYNLRKELKEEKRLKEVYIDLCTNKVNEIDILEREARLIWNLYGIDYRKRLDGLQALLEEMKGD